MHELGTTGSVACVIPVGDDGAVDGNDIVEANGHLREAGVSRRSVPTRIKCAFVKERFSVLIDVVRGVGQAKDVLMTNVFGKGVGVALIRRMAMWVFDVWCGAVGAGMSRWDHVGVWGGGW